MLQAKSLEFLLSLGTEGVRPRRPEARDGRPDGGVVGAGVGVDVAGIGDLALYRRVDAVDLGASEGAKAVDAKLLAQCVDSSVLKELVARVIDRGNCGVVFESSLARDLLGEVFARVEVFEEAADGVDVEFGEFNLARLCDGLADR